MSRPISLQTSLVSPMVPPINALLIEGQIFLEAELFFRGIRPAINVGLSVSRVGSAAQLKVLDLFTFLSIGNETSRWISKIVLSPIS